MGIENTAQAFWVQAPGLGTLRTENLPVASGDQLTVRALYSGVSRGTESLVFTGGVPRSQYQAMRCPFQAGDFPGPVKYGYMSVGVVETSGPLGGRTVFCLHPHQDRYVVPAASVVPVPDDVPAGRAILAANMETAVNGVWDAAPGVGDRVLVLGAGVVGLLTAWLCSRIPGVELTIVDPDPAKAGAAQTLGLPFATRIPDLGGRGADVVIHASGHPSGAADALGAAGVEARIVELSWFGDTTVPLPLGEDFHARRLTIRSSQVGRIPPDRAARWDYRRRLELALSLLRASELDALITGESAFEDLPSVMPRLTSPDQTVLCHRIAYTNPQTSQES